MNMEDKEIKSRLKEIKTKLMHIEWDRKHSHTLAKSHLEENLKKEREELRKKLSSNEN